jgi:type I restriction enzyme M protein
MFEQTFKNIDDILYKDAGAGVKTVVLSFTKGEPTEKICYYQLDPGRIMGKNTLLSDADMRHFVTSASSVSQNEYDPETSNSWNLDIRDLRLRSGHDLSVKNPNGPVADPLREPADILQEIQDLDEESAEILSTIKKFVG